MTLASSAASPHSSALSGPAVRLDSSQKKIIATCSVVAAIDGFDTLLPAFVAPLLARGWHLVPHQLGQLFAIGYLGAVIGALSIGAAADRFGRRSTLMCSLVIVAIFTFLGAQASSVHELMLYRFAAGLGLGGAIPVVNALTAECLPPQIRSKYVTRMFLGYPIGSVVGGALAAMLLARFNWPAVFVLGGILALVALVLVHLFVPAHLPHATHASRAPSRSPLASLKLQFADGRSASLLLLWVATFLVMVVTYFMVSWIAVVLALTGLPPAKAALGNVAFSVGGIVGAFGIARLTSRHGPFRPAACLMVLGALTMCAFGATLGQPALAVAAVTLVGFGVLGGQLMFPAMSARLFPNHVRGAGNGALMSMGRLGSIVGPMIGGVLLSRHLPWTILFTGAAVPVIVAAIAIWLSDRLLPDRATPENRATPN